MSRFKFPIIAAVIVLAVGLVVAGVAYYLNNNSSLLNVETNKPKSKTYEYVKKYESRAGEEEMKITMLVEDQVIKDLGIEHEANNRVSTNYQTQFSEGIEGVVVGKKITDEFSRSSINGASVTTAAFWEAFDEVIKQ